MRCPYCAGEAERITYMVDPLPGIVGDQVRVTLLVCWVCGLVDREAEMVMPVDA